MKDIFTKLDLVHYYEMANPSKRDIDNCIKNVRTRLFEEYSQEYMENINNMPVLRSYCNFETELKMENYLLIIRSFKLRSIVSRFRLSSHSLTIEKGRQVKPKKIKGYA